MEQFAKAVSERKEKIQSYADDCQNTQLITYYGLFIL